MPVYSPSFCQVLIPACTEGRLRLSRPGCLVPHRGKKEPIKDGWSSNLTSQLTPFISVIFTNQDIRIANSVYRGASSKLRKNVRCKILRITVYLFNLRSAIPELLSAGMPRGKDWHEMVGRLVPPGSHLKIHNGLPGTLKLA